MTDLERAFRDERAAVLATVARRLGDLQLAEDAVQEAFAAAVARWPVTGVPERPGAWLTTTAWRKAIDMRRRQRPTTTLDAVDDVPADAAGAGDGHVLAAAADGSDAAVDTGDDLLTLVLACCHPALSVEAQVALTLRHVAGLTTSEIAAAFLVPEPTMAKRLVRARGKIRDAGVPFAVPTRTALADRLAPARAVVYLVFSEGYLATGDGPPVRRELCDEAVWLARQLHRLAPDDGETTGLLALLLLQNARAGARETGGRLVRLGDQDRRLWDQTAIDEARSLLGGAPGPPGPHRLQAAIALLHAVSPSADDVDWPQVARLYDALARLDPGAAVAVNRAVAVGRADGPAAGLAALAPSLADPSLARYLPLLVAHADLLERAAHPGASEAWRRAASVAANATQRDELLRRVVDG